MSDVKYDIQYAKDIINYGSCGMFRRVYPFTNENLVSCFSNFDFKDKDCLTVLASSDQALDMFLKGAKSVSTFDINCLTKYYFYLKKAFLSSELGYEDFIDFFSLWKDGTFLRSTFDKISKYLSGDNYIFWSTLFDECDSLKLRYELFLDGEANYNILSKTVNYLNAENFKLIKGMAKDIDIDFYNCDILDLSNFINRNYDIMYFSNIMQYIDKMYKDFCLSPKTNQLHKLKKFKSVIMELSKNLNDCGNMLISYIYDPCIIFDHIPLFNSSVRNAVFDKKTFDYIPFKSEEGLINNCDQYDAVLTYRKKS